VQVHLGDSPNSYFTIVGLADKTVAKSRERVRAALSAIGLALPYRQITVNLSPADLPKEGSHYDLPIALGLLSAMRLSKRARLKNPSQLLSHRFQRLACLPFSDRCI
jgi:predicted ATPase with chaperone activity